ncbi:MAG: long-chain fatty acid--CoA ligase [Actinomycetia bacterium]|nr:long-chain fatty acid--CoA ligase [Actinomycetes bacterium]MCP5032276.1 long-chain fatty acid--CoA ligase [Actinomycetes bacterium]
MSGGWTIADCVAVNARSFPDKVAIEVLDPRRQGVAPVETWTYGELWARVEALAGAMTEAVGDRQPGRHGLMVGFMLANSVDHLAAYLACQHIGAAAVPVNNRLAEPEVAFVLADSDASLVLTDESFSAVAVGAAAEVGVEVLDVARVATGQESTWSQPSGLEAASKVAAVAYTSGTTGFPKGSIVTNRGLTTRLSQWCWTFGLNSKEVLSTPGPVFHLSYGGLSLAHLAVGGRNRLMVDFDPVVALDEYANHSTWVFLVPTMTAMIAEAWKAAGRPDLDSLRWMLSSGAPGPMSLLDEAFDIYPNANIAEGYGWTEGGWVTYEVKDRTDLVAHSVGWPMVGTEIDLRTDDGSPAPVGQPGEVVARSIAVFSGYLGNEAATAAAMTDDGFCRSGDLGIRLPDGRLTIVDRVKDMIISGGENIYCAEVERILIEHEGIVEAAVVGLADEEWGERVTAGVVPRVGTTLDPDDVIAHCRQRLAAYKCPKEIVIVDELPLNPMGKVQKFRLVEALEGR